MRPTSKQCATRPTSKQCAVRPSSTQQALRDSGDKWRFITQAMNAPSSPFTSQREKCTESPLAGTVPVAPSLLASLEAISPNARWLSGFRASQTFPGSIRSTPQKHDIQLTGFEPIPVLPPPKAESTSVFPAATPKKHDIIPNTPKLAGGLPQQATPRQDRLEQSANSSRQVPSPRAGEIAPAPPRTRTRKAVRFKVGKRQLQPKSNDVNDSSASASGDIFSVVPFCESIREESSLTKSKNSDHDQEHRNSASMSLSLSQTGSGHFTPGSPLKRHQSISPGDMRRWRMRQYRRRSTHSLLSQEANTADPFVYFARTVQSIRHEFDFHEDDELRQLDDLVDELKHADLPLLFSRGHPMNVECLNRKDPAEEKPISASLSGALPEIQPLRSVTAAAVQRDCVFSDKAMVDVFSPSWDLLTAVVSERESKFLQESVAELELLGLVNVQRVNTE